MSNHKLLFVLPEIGAVYGVSTPILITIIYTPGKGPHGVAGVGSVGIDTTPVVHQCRGRYPILWKCLRIVLALIADIRTVDIHLLHTRAASYSDISDGFPLTDRLDVGGEFGGHGSEQASHIVCLIEHQPAVFIFLTGDSHLFDACATACLQPMVTNSACVDTALGDGSTAIILIGGEIGKCYGVTPTVVGICFGRNLLKCAVLTIRVAFVLPHTIFPLCGKRCVNLIIVIYLP